MMMLSLIHIVLLKLQKHFYQVYQIWVLDELKPTQFILIEAEPSEIMYRRMNDPTRVRDMEYTDGNRFTSQAYVQEQQQ